MNRFQDRLDGVGLPVGLFVLLVGLGTLVGRPWRYAADGPLLVVLQLLGALLAVAIGLGIFFLGHVVDR
jgi:hypothetical protein